MSYEPMVYAYRVIVCDDAMGPERLEKVLTDLSSSEEGWRMCGSTARFIVFERLVGLKSLNKEQTWHPSSGLQA